MPRLRGRLHRGDTRQASRGLVGAALRHSVVASALLRPGGVPPPRHAAVSALPGPARVRRRGVIVASVVALAARSARAVARTTGVAGARPAVAPLVAWAVHDDRAVRGAHGAAAAGLRAKRDADIDPRRLPGEPACASRDCWRGWRRSRRRARRRIAFASGSRMTRRAPRRRAEDGATAFSRAA